MQESLDSLKIRQVRHSQKYGYLIPRNYTEALEFDKAIITVNGMIQQRQKWILYIHIKSLKSMTRPSLMTQESY